MDELYNNIEAIYDNINDNISIYLQIYENNFSIMCLNKRLKNINIYVKTFSLFQVNLLILFFNM